MTDQDNPAPMLPDAVNEALDRLAAAVARLQAGAERRAGPRPSPDREQEMAVMQEDRARLADDLDTALAKVERLSQAQAAVRDRIDRAAHAITTALGRMGDEVPAATPAEQPEEPEIDHRPARRVREAR